MEAALALMQGGCEEFQQGRWVLAGRMRLCWPVPCPQLGAASLSVKYMKEISPYFKNSSTGATVSWDPSPATLQKRSSPLLPARELREGRTVPLKMCYVSRKCLPADPEHRSGHGAGGGDASTVPQSTEGRRGPSGAVSLQVPGGVLGGRARCPLPAGEGRGHGAVVAQRHPGQRGHAAAAGEGGAASPAGRCRHGGRTGRQARGLADRAGTPMPLTTPCHRAAGGPDPVPLQLPSAGTRNLLAVLTEKELLLYGSLPQSRDALGKPAHSYPLIATR